MKEKYYVIAKTITKWKLDNPIENWLGYKADKSEFWKRLYVLYYKIFDHQYYSKGKKYIHKEIDKQLPNLSSLCLGGGINLSRNWLEMDMIYSLHRWGINFMEYFVHKYYLLNSIGREQVNNLRLQYGFCELVNAPYLRELFDNKGLTYETFKSFYKRDLIAVNSNDDLSSFETFVQKHTSFIYKPLKGVHGTGIKIYKNITKEYQGLFKELLNNGAYVLEELIEQKEGMAKLHPESINTLRLATFKIGNDVNVYAAAVRMGTGNAIVDNAGSGGIFCHVNHEYGFISSNAKDWRNNEYVFHPDTGVRFIGFDIPEWNQAIELVHNMARTISDATVISWDLAYSKKGWCMVEANDVGGPELIQGNGVYNKSVLHNMIDKYFKSHK